MLQKLRIKNFVLIKELDMDPFSGFNIITGETGAGKSIMLGAIGLLLGDRADGSVLFDPEQKGIIEGHFHLADYDLKEIFDEEDLDYLSPCIIRRELAPNGRSRAFINDTPVRLETLKLIGSRLMDVHSQHQNLELGSRLFQLQVLDAFAGSLDALKQYKGIYKEWQSVSRMILDKEAEQALLHRDQDYNRFMFEELESANLLAGELEEIEEELNVLESAEEIRGKLSEAVQVLKDSEYAVLAGLRQARAIFQQLRKFGKSFQELSERLDSVFYELDDIAVSVEQAADSVELNPERAHMLRERVDLLYRLLKKHQAENVAQLISIRDDYASRLNTTRHTDEELEALKKKAQVIKKSLLQAGEVLSKQRKEAKSALASEVSAKCANLGMPNAVFEILVNAMEPGPQGMDEIRFLFSANKGLVPGELKDVASGGEFSRLIFILKFIIAGRTALPSILFDEIDSGISGEIAFRMAAMMREMARNHQVMTITHLPQMAAAGEKHFFVYKDHSSDRTISKIKALSEEEHVQEIASMIGGVVAGAAAIQSAVELIQAFNKQ